MSTHRDPNESVEQPRETPLCANNCGFFANPACGGYCSKCYRDIAAVEQPKPKEPEKPKDEVAPAVGNAGPQTSPVLAQPDTVSPPATSVPAVTAELGRPAATPVVVSPPLRVSKTRCGVCRKKVGLTGFECKCGSLFCGAHRYAESHACTFDHKTTERQRLAEHNPVVQGSKLDRL